MGRATVARPAARPVSVLGRDACDTDAFFPPGGLAVSPCLVRAISSLNAAHSHLRLHLLQVAAKANGSHEAREHKLKPPMPFQKDSRMDAFLLSSL